MKKLTGSKIQDLEKIIIANMKETGLVEHPHIYHGDLKNPNELITLAYKTAETYRNSQRPFDPFIQVFPLPEILMQSYSGIIEIKTEYHELSNTHRLHIKLEGSSVADAIEFKYNMLQIINNSLVRYITTNKKITLDDNKKGKRHKK